MLSKPTTTLHAAIPPAAKLANITLAALATVAGMSGAVQAQSTVSVTGTIDLGARHTRNSVGALKSLSSGNSSTSVLMFRGSEDMGGGLLASFWLESSIFADTGTVGSLTLTPTGQFFDRRSTVSLQNQWGELRLGRDWNPVFLGYVYSDPFFAVGVGSTANFLNASVNTVYTRAFGNAAFPTTISRVNNAVEYHLPANLGGVNGQLMLGAGEGNNGNGGFKYSGGRLGYRDGGVDVSAYASSTHIDAQAADLKQAGLAGSYKTGALRVSASYTQTTFLSSKQNHYLLGATYTVGAGNIKLSYNNMDQQGTGSTGASIAANDARQFGLGYEHYLSKRTVLYGNAGRLNNSGAAKFAIPGGPAGVAGGSSSTGYELGMRHSF